MLLTCKLIRISYKQKHKHSKKGCPRPNSWCTERRTCLDPFKPRTLGVQPIHTKKHDTMSKCYMNKFKLKTITKIVNADPNPGILLRKLLIGTLRWDMSHKIHKIHKHKAEEMSKMLTLPELDPLD